MNKKLVAYVVVGVLCWPLTTGMIFADSANIYESKPTLGAIYIKSKERREQGDAALWGMIFAAMWPVGVPIVYMMTGFAEHGIRFQMK